jgi:hypothetical protein
VGGSIFLSFFFGFVDEACYNGTPLGYKEWALVKQKLSHSAIPIILSWHELNYNILIPTIRQTQAIFNHVFRWGKLEDMVALLGNYESI